MYETEGTIESIGDTETFGDGHKKRKCILKLGVDTKGRENLVEFEAMFEATESLETYAAGETVIVTWELSGNRGTTRNGDVRVFNNLTLKEIRAVNDERAF